MTLLRQKPIKIINKCGAIFDYDILSNAILWYSNKPVQRIKNVFLHGKYAAVSIGNEKLHIHRLIMEYIIGEKHIKREIHIHHKDGNKMNDAIDNLEIINAHDHLSLHNKGKEISDKLRTSIIERNHRYKGKRKGFYRNDVTPIDVYNLKKKGFSFNKISNMLDLDWSCVKRRYNDFIHDNPELLEGGE